MDSLQYSTQLMDTSSGPSSPRSGMSSNTFLSTYGLVSGIATDRPFEPPSILVFARRRLVDHRLLMSCKLDILILYRTYSSFHGWVKKSVEAIVVIVDVGVDWECCCRTHSDAAQAPENDLSCETWRYKRKLWTGLQSAAPRSFALDPLHA